MKKLIFLLFLLASSIAATTLFAIATRDARREATIAQANADALLDTVQRYVRDSTQTATLMFSQDSVNADSIASLLGSLGDAVRGRDEALRALSTMRVQFAVLRDEFESVRIEEHTEEPESQDGTFEIEGPPVEGTVTVRYRPRDPWSLFTELRPSPFDLTYSIGCDPAHRAIVNVTTPTWVTVTPERGTVTPDVCNPPRVGFSLLPEISFKGIGWELGKGLVWRFIWEAIENAFEDSPDYDPGS